MVSLTSIFSVYLEAVNSTIGNEVAWPSNALSIVGSLQSCKEEEYIQGNLSYPSDYDLDRDNECTDGGYESDWSGTGLFTVSFFLNKFAS